MTTDASLPPADVQRPEPLTERIGKPWGIQCFGCNRRFVGPGAPASGPLDAVAWEEGLCGREECPVWEMMGVKKR